MRENGTQMWKKVKWMIVIKGMEMPKNCFRCDLVCKCRWYLDTDTRPYNCPLVEVPSVDTERKTGKWIRNDNGTWSSNIIMHVFACIAGREWTVNRNERNYMSKLHAFESMHIHGQNGACGKQM